MTASSSGCEAGPQGQPVGDENAINPTASAVHALADGYARLGFSRAVAANDYRERDENGFAETTERAAVNAFTLAEHLRQWACRMNVETVTEETA